jgi:hypothetical protein
MPNLDLPPFVAGRSAATVDASLRQALHACDRARECAVLWFAEVQRRGLYRDLGHASMELYVVEGLACSRNRYWQFKRLADQLEALPVLKAAVADGQVGWTKAQQVARVATAETEAAWVDRAVVGGRRELEVAVRSAMGRRPVRVRRAEAAGQLALGVAPAQVEGAVVAEVVDLSTTISLRADAVQLARFEALLEKARKLRLLPAGSDRLDVVLAGLEALVAAGDAASSVAARPFSPTFQIIVQQCSECGAAATVTQRGERPLAPAQVAAIGCDARVKRAGAPNRSVIPPSVRTAVLARDRHRCTTPGCGAAHFLEVHHVVARSRGGSNKAENLVTLCGRCHRFLHEREGRIAPAQVVGAECEQVDR